MIQNWGIMPQAHAINIQHTTGHLWKALAGPMIIETDHGVLMRPAEPNLRHS